MLSIKPTSNSPKIIIDFKEVLFEVSGVSKLEDPATFYNPVLRYIQDNFFDVQNSIHYSGAPSLTIHFYLSEVADRDLEMIAQIDDFLSRVSEFRTYIYWYFNDEKPLSVSTAERVKQTFKNFTRLIKNNVWV